MTSHCKINILLLSAAMCTCAGLVAGCKPSFFWREADEAATGIIERQQQEAFGESSPFTIDRPADTLRRRLMIAQDLPHTGAASLGSDQLEVIDHWPAEARPAVVGAGPGAIQALPDGTPLKLPLLEALQIAAANARDYRPARKRCTPPPCGSSWRATSSATPSPAPST